MTFNAALRTLKRFVRRAKGGLAQAAGRPRPVARTNGPVLSVVVPVYNVQGYVAACLDSVLGQTLEQLEVIVVDDGSSDRSPQILADYARRDPRIHIITQGNQGLGAARNVGVDVATAPFLTFLDADDTVPAGAYALMVSALKRTGSDFAVGAVRRHAQGKTSRPAWVTQVHEPERLHITIDDFPGAMQDVIACNRMFRRQFWRDKIGPFPTGLAYEDHAPMVTAYLRARSFDLLAATTYHWYIRQDGTSIGQQKHQTGNLRDRIAVKDLAWEVVSREAAPPVISAYVARVLGLDLPMFIRVALTSDDDYREVLRQAVVKWSERADERAWRDIRVDLKQLLRLTAAGKWAQIDVLVEHLRLAGALTPTHVVEGRIVAHPPPGVQFLFAPETLELSRQQTDLSACIRQVRWLPDGDLEVNGWAFIPGIDLRDHTSTVTAALVHRGSGRTMPLTVQPFSCPAITRWANHPHQCYDDAGFSIRVPVASLPSSREDAARWQLELQVETAGVVRTGSVHSITRTGIANRMRAQDLTEENEIHRWVPVLDDSLGFALYERSERLRATSLEAHGPRLSGTLRVLIPWSASPLQVVARRGDRTVSTGPLVQQPDGEWSFTLSVTGTDSAEHLDFRVQDGRGRFHRVSWLSAAPDAVVGSYGPGQARWQRTPAGFVQVGLAAHTLRAHQVRVSAESITVQVTAPGLPVGALEGAVLQGAHAQVPVGEVAPRNEGYQLSFPAAAALWGSGTPRPLPAGTYSVTVPTGRGTSLTCGVTEELMERMPWESLTDTHGVTIARKPATGHLTIGLRAPLKDDERGRTASQRLERDHLQRVRGAAMPFAPTDQVLFQCYRGEFASDSQRAIHDELVRRGSPLELVWGIRDWSVAVPPGGRGVLLGSRDWFEVLGGARYLCHNIEFDRFFRRGDHQKFLQTFHGYPFKSMGVSYWTSRHLSEHLIAENCRRRTDAWTSIVVPAPFCADLYRQEYRYGGEVLVSGYPRNDALVDADPAVRTEVLNRLGIAPDKTVVLFAPTWREAGATGSWSAVFFGARELDAIADALGDDYVILQRGHSFNLRAESVRSSQANIIDVTAYPEINDLVLAADVAVLDYSSLRFDWVLTGKPLLFFVPDLEDYFDARAALFEFGPTAPGPLLSTTAEVIDALRSLDAVANEYGRAIKECNERFNELHDGRATERVVDAFFGADAGPKT